MILVVLFSLRRTSSRIASNSVVVARGHPDIGRGHLDQEHPIEPLVPGLGHRLVDSGYRLDGHERLRIIGMQMFRRVETRNWDRDYTGVGLVRGKICTYDICLLSLSR